MDLTNTTLTTFYEGADPSLYDDLTGLTFNTPLRELLANDQALKASATTLEGSSNTAGNNVDSLVTNLTGFETTQGTRISDIDTQIAGIENDLATLTGLLTQAENDLSASVTLMGDASTGLVRDSSRHNESINALNTDLSNFSSRLTAQENSDSLAHAARIEEYLSDLEIEEPLNQNGFLIGGLTLGPIGYSGTGNCVVSAVSTYTKGFQGSYLENRPTDAATTQDAATVTNTFYYGAWNTGPRTIWGGLHGGNHTPINSYRPSGSSTTNDWVSTPSKEGCLLKLHKPSGGQNHRNNACLVTMKYYCNTREIRFRAYVWVDSGPLNFKFGPLNGSTTISVPNLKVWTPVDVVVNTRGSTGKYWRIILDSSALQTIYIGMLGIYPVAGSGDSASSLNV